MTTKKPPTITTSARVLAAEHIGELLTGISGIIVLICATVAAIFGVLSSDALAVILGGAAGGGVGYGAGRAAK